MSSPSVILRQQIAELSYYYECVLDSQWSYVIVRGVNLPPGFNQRTTDVWIALPPDYPISPPGIGDYRVFVAGGLRFRGRILADYHDGYAHGWAYLCYRRILWDPHRDTLVRFLEMLRADLTSPSLAQ
jgi:hypothetical protein